MTLSHKLIGVVCFILSIDRYFSKKKKKSINRWKSKNIII